MGTFLLAHKFRDPELNLTLELFLHLIRGALGDRLTSLILHGSVVFDDLAPGSGDLGLLARMLEGAFLPESMPDPAVTGSALWWGTSGEPGWERNELGWLVQKVLRERGQTPLLGAGRQAQFEERGRRLGAGQRSRALARTPPPGPPYPLDPRNGK
ncbi:MAG TPA: hypothetical protein VGL40_04695 [Bacillota bacterium]